MAVIALDLGGTKLSAALFYRHSEICYKHQQELGKRQGKEVGHLISNTVNELLDKAQTLNENVSAIGSERRDRSRNASKFAGENYPYRLHLAGRPDRRDPPRRQESQK